MSKVKTALAAAVALAFASGAHAAVQELPFDFNATGFGGGTVKGAKDIDFSYQAEVDFNGNRFDMSGVAFFGSFRKELGLAPIAGTGLGTDYGLYAEFIGSGTRTNIAPGVN